MQTPEYDFKITSPEKKSIIKAIRYVIHELQDELPIRSGFTIDEFEELISFLKKSDSNHFKLTRIQLLMLHQLFNEIINGVHISDHQIFIGMRDDDAKKIFSMLDNIIELSSN